MEKVNRKKLTIVLCVVTALLTILFCLFNPVKEHSIFSIPTGTSAEKLEQEGFMVHSFSDRKPISAWLPLSRDCHVYVDFDPRSAGAWKAYHIFLNVATFHKLTGVEPKNYEAIEVDGYDYSVETAEGGVVMKRLGV